MPPHSPKNASLATPDLSVKEKREAQKRIAVTAMVVYEAIRKQGKEELDRPASALAWSGFAAGLTMAFSLVVQGLLRSHLPDVP